MDTPTAYAHNIVNGVRPAGELVRLSCQRHMDDLQRSKEDPTCPWILGFQGGSGNCRVCKTLSERPNFCRAEEGAVRTLWS